MCVCVCAEIDGNWFIDHTIKWIEPSVRIDVGYAKCKLKENTKQNE